MHADRIGDAGRVLAAFDLAPDVMGHAQAARPRLS
jgi:hypothetical protein